jgi:hypothetical protein
LDSCRDHLQIANLSVIRRFDYESNNHVACLFVHHVGSTSSTITISLNSIPARYTLGRHIPTASSLVHNQHEVILTHDRKTIHHHVCPCVRHSTIQFQHLIEASDPVVASFFRRHRKGQDKEETFCNGHGAIHVSHLPCPHEEFDYSRLPLSVPVMLPCFL